MKQKIVIVFFVLISIIIIIAARLIYYFLPSELSLEISQLISAVAASLAALWFSVGLWLQAKQLNDQKVQFIESFKYMRQDSKRNTLQFCSELLEKTVEKIQKTYPEIEDIQQITKYYIDLTEMKIMLESTDPNEIIESGQKWFRKEAPARILMSNLNFAALLYFDATGLSYTKNKDPEESFYINGTILRDVPIFQEYCGVGELLSQFMFTLKPGRDSALFAYNLAMALSVPKGIMKTDSLNEQYKKMKENNKNIPAIWSKYNEEFSFENNS